jgi:hypothetical protein
MTSRPIFERRHYNYLAAWWRGEPLNDMTVKHSLLRFVAMLLNTQANFNATRFFQACGFTRSEASDMADQCRDTNRSYKDTTDQVVNDKAR